MSGDESEAMVRIGWCVLVVAYAALCVWLAIRFVNRRERWAKWTALAVALAPLIYALSSGPLTTLAFRSRVTHTSVSAPGGGTTVQATSVRIIDRWFAIAYQPLFWAGEQDWGDPVYSYWELFPNRRTSTDDH